MIRELDLDPQRQLAIPDELTTIDFAKDAIICVRKYESLDILNFDIDEFVIRNRDALVPTQRSYFLFRPHLKILAPIGIEPTYHSTIPGLWISNVKYDKQRGSTSTCGGDYLIYSNFEFEIKILSDHRFIADKRFIGLRIPVGTDIFAVKFIYTFLGEKFESLRDIVYIKDSYIFERLPNF